ncbi:MAG TPA: CRISPR-associated endoribonuclease Cas6 [Ignavibacteriaceae bacterium]|nr:CRISPR-associated endoribonuclease Cas6 [Ignavibacteriaceae bacterium]
MRLKICMLSGSDEIPVNYNYYLSMAIYKLFELDTPEFSSYLDDIGFPESGKPFQLYTFALRFNALKIENETIHLMCRDVNLYVSFPLIDDFIKDVIPRIIKENRIEIETASSVNIFAIMNIKKQQEPVFGKQNRFTLLSPLVIASKKDFDFQRPLPYYLRFNDNINEINWIINQDLKTKYKMIYNSEYNGNNLTFEWDNDYIKTKLSNNQRLTKKISIRRGNSRNREIIGNMIPIVLTGEEALIKVGYDTGFGEQNSMGFGMADFYSAI